MDNITGLMVALMFVTLLTIGFGNILGAIAPRLGTPKGFAAHPWQSLWWAILALVVLDTFWRCVAIFSIDSWSFAEFLYVQIGAVMLFFASTCLPTVGSTDAPSDGPPDRDRVFFGCLAVFQLWVLGLAPLFGAPSAVAMVVNLLMLLPPSLLALRPRAAIYPLATAAMAALTGLSVMT